MTCQHVFHVKISRPEPTSPQPPLWGSHAQGHFFHVPIISGPDNRHLEQPLYPKAFWDYSDQPIVSLLTLPCLVRLIKTTVKTLAHIFPSSPLPSDPPISFPCGAVWYGRSLLLESVCNKLSFQWQSPLDLLASPHLNNNTYITKKNMGLHFVITTSTEHLYFLHFCGHDVLQIKKSRYIFYLIK